MRNEEEGGCWCNQHDEIMGEGYQYKITTTKDREDVMEKWIST